MKNKIRAVLRWEPGVRVAIYLMALGVPFWWLLWGLGLICRSFRYSRRIPEEIWISLSISTICWTIYNSGMSFWITLAGVASIAALIFDAIEGSDQTYFRRLLARLDRCPSPLKTRM